MPLFPTINDLADALASGKTTAASLLAQSLARTDAKSAAHVYISRLDEDARKQAAEADQLRGAGKAGRYTGIPITIKDNLDLKGRPTTGGSKILATAAPAATDAPVVTKLRSAGFVILGRTNMTEFAFSGLGLNPHYGTPANPAFKDAAHIPGGSSSGAIVSVGLGIAPAAIGTDTGGSVRIPAAFCGLVGFKPTADAVSTEGVLPLSTTLDSVGVMAQTVADCRAVFEVIRSSPHAAPAAKTGKRIGVITNFVQNGMQPEVAEAFNGAVDRLRKAGFTVENITLPILDNIPEIMKGGSIAQAEAAAWHNAFLPGAPDDAYDPRVIGRVRPGNKITPEALKKVLERRGDIIEAFTAAAAGFDALAWPTVPITAPSMDSLTEDDVYHRTNGLVLRNSTVGNLADACAISLPCPTGGAPVGMTLAAAHGHDTALLAFAESVETALLG